MPRFEFTLKRTPTRRMKYFAINGDSHDELVEPMNQMFEECGIDEVPARSGAAAAWQP